MLFNEVSAATVVLYRRAICPRLSPACTVTSVTVVSEAGSLSIPLLGDRGSPHHQLLANPDEIGIGQAVQFHEGFHGRAETQRQGAQIIARLHHVGSRLDLGRLLFRGGSPSLLATTLSCCPT